MAHYASLYHGGASMLPLPPAIPVRSVWKDNLKLELRFLHSFVHNARYAAVNIHYPGTADERYSVIKANVDALKPIQVGLAIYNDFGHIVAWEFNLCGFHPVTDPHATNSVGAWEDNLELELRFLHSFIHNARYGAVNIHYPGVIHSGSEKHTSQTADERYSVIKANVGLAIYNDFSHIVAWEFNLRGFHPVTDPHAANSVGVWEDNLELELRFLHSFVHNARYAAMNIHYPGVIHNGSQKHTSQMADERYSVIKANVDALKPIHVGLAIYNDFGHIVAWEFNLRGFHTVTDPHAANSVGYL
ncbi:hypothetical protein SORBI_3010G147300 [Sorghum bicolor]|uniref:Uncharacterized protein n=1 Tax=Sorghum bicolor TaxID=4558 RepID=A0A1W0VT36_SORBI|nr:hypothetical protein SORBI_3010G147300 [Sorghum bicolor]